MSKTDIHKLKWRKHMKGFHKYKGAHLMSKCKFEYTSLEQTHFSKFEVASKHGTNQNQGWNLQNHASVYDYANAEIRRNDQVHEKRTQRATQFFGKLKSWVSTKVPKDSLITFGELHLHLVECRCGRRWKNECGPKSNKIQNILLKKPKSCSNPLPHCQAFNIGPFWFALETQLECAHMTLVYSFRTHLRQKP